MFHDERMYKDNRTQMIYCILHDEEEIVCLVVCLDQEVKFLS